MKKNINFWWIKKSLIFPILIPKKAHKMSSFFTDRSRLKPAESARSLIQYALFPIFKWFPLHFSLKTGGRENEEQIPTKWCCSRNFSLFAGWSCRNLHCTSTCLPCNRAISRFVGVALWMLERPVSFPQNSVVVPTPRNDLPRDLQAWGLPAGDNQPVVQNRQGEHREGKNGREPNNDLSHRALALRKPDSRKKETFLKEISEFKNIKTHFEFYGIFPF